jgi:hypothetical protein
LSLGFGIARGQNALKPPRGEIGERACDYVGHNVSRNDTVWRFTRWTALLLYY